MYHCHGSQYFESNVELMDTLFDATFCTLEAIGKPLSRCGHCTHYMKHITSKPPRLHCAHCDETYNLPTMGAIKLFKELVCPLDGFELLLFTQGAAGKSYTLCPYCYNHPPFEDFNGKNMGCNACLHPTCKHSMTVTNVCRCPECENGVLCVDPNSYPIWRMCCNACNLVVRVGEKGAVYKLSAMQVN